MDHDHIDAHDVRSRYVAGHLTDDEEGEFEAHLVDCPTCIDAVEAEVSLRDGLRLVESRRPPQPAAPTPAELRSTVPGWGLRVAAGVLLAASVGLAAWTSRSAVELIATRRERDELQRRAREAEQSVNTLQRRLAQGRTPETTTLPRPPQVVPAVVFALSTVRGSSSADAAPVNRVHLAGNATLVVFSLEVPPIAGAAAGVYEVTLKDRGAHVLWTGGTFPPSSPDSLGVAIDRSLLHDGDYALELSLRSAAGPTTIGRYTFRVEGR